MQRRVFCQASRIIEYPSFRRAFSYTCLAGYKRENDPPRQPVRLSDLRKKPSSTDSPSKPSRWLALLLGYKYCTGMQTHFPYGNRSQTCCRPAPWEDKQHLDTDKPPVYKPREAYSRAKRVAQEDGAPGRGRRMPSFESNVASPEEGSDGPEKDNQGTKKNKHQRRDK